MAREYTHNPEVVTVVFTDAALNTTPDIEDRPATLLEYGAYVFDEHGCELGLFNIMSDFSVDPADHCFGPSAEHPDRDVFGWPEGFQSMPVAIYNGVDEAWACPDLDGAFSAAVYEAAQKTDIDPADYYGPDLSWFGANKTCEGWKPGTIAYHGPDGYGRVVVIDHNPATNAVRVKNPDDTGRFAPVWLVNADDLILEVSRGAA